MGIRYKLDLSASAKTLASQGRIAAQRRVYINPTQAIVAPIAELRQDAVDATGDGDEGTITQEFGYSYPAGAVGTHMIVVLDSACASPDGNVVVSFDVTVAGGGTDTATATFALPSQAANQTKVFPKGMAVDLVPDTDATLKITAITGLNGITYGAVGTLFRVLAVPAFNDSGWVELKRMRSFNGALPSPAPVDIAHNFDSSFDIVQGREALPSLSGSQVAAGAYDDARRYNGTTVALMVQDWVDGRTLVNTQLFGGVVLGAKMNSGDGNAEQTIDLDGMIREFALFLV